MNERIEFLEGGCFDQMETLLAVVVLGVDAIEKQHMEMASFIQQAKIKGHKKQLINKRI